MPQKPVRNPKELNAEGIYEFRQSGSIMKALQAPVGATQVRKKKRLCAVVAFYEDQEPELFLPKFGRSTVSLPPGEGYKPEKCTLTRSDYAVCVQFTKSGGDPSWTIINGKRVHS